MRICRVASVVGDCGWRAFQPGQADFIGPTVLVARTVVVKLGIGGVLRVRVGVANVRLDIRPYDAPAV